MESRLAGVFPLMSAIEWGSRQWAGPVLALIALSAVLLCLNYLGNNHQRLVNLGLMMLKGVAFTLIAICLLNPTLIRNQMRPGENIVVLLVDRSSSLTIQSGKRTRGEEFQQLIRQDRGEWLTRLTQDFDLRRYTFDDRLEQFEDADALQFVGPQSQIGAALSSLEERFRSQPLAAVLLMSDGNDSQPSMLEQTAVSVPVYPVVLSSAETLGFDVSVDQLGVTESPFESSPVTISATVETTSEKDVPVIAVLQRSDSTESEPLQKKKLRVSATTPAALRFELRPEQLGVEFYRVRVFPDGEDGVFAEPLLSTEVTLKNNERLAVVNRRSQKSRILYVGGRPNWEFKFLNRAFSEDREVDLVGMIRIARKEARFDFRGRVGEDANSLFRGQDREADEETESYDEAVLIRLNARDQAELADGFPKTRQDLFAYDALILDDIEARFFTPDQHSLIDRFVSERGGGLFMLGGRDSFRHGEWHKTPLRDALPMYLDRQQRQSAGPWTWTLTREGWLEPWMRVRATEDAEKKRLNLVPPLSIHNQLDEPKPGARVFASVRDEQGRELPAIVAQQYGAGRSVGVLVGDLWRWSIQKAEDDEDDLARTWRQMVRWLIADVPRRLETQRTWTQLGGVPAVQLQVRVRDSEFLPQENAHVEVEVRTPEETTLLLDAEPSLQEPGLFEVALVPRAEGAYLADITVTTESDPLPMTDQIGWVSQPDAEEFERITWNESALRQLAERSGGEIVKAEELPEFIRSLPQRELPVTEIHATPLWHSPWILLVALSCLAAEWGLRRLRGLP